MKNVVVFVCDGLSYYMTEDRENHPSPMRFLMQLKSVGTHWDKAYSQAPYTEGGMMGLMYGRNPLDNGAYTVGMQEWDKSLYQSLYENGYDLFTSYYGSSTPPELITKGYYMYDENYLNPMFSRYIRGKLDYYNQVIKTEHHLKDEDYIILERLLDRHFDTMLFWHSPEADKRDYTDVFNPCVENTTERSRQINSWKSTLNNEFDMYQKNKRLYIDDIFDKYESHFITNDCNVKGLPFNDLIISQRKYVENRYGKLFKDIKIKNEMYFLKNKQIPFNQLITFAIHDRSKLPEYVYRTLQACSKFDYSKMVSTSLEQLVVSARAYVRGFKKWYEGRENDTNPFFLYLHCDEFHRPLSFYSHDIHDKNLVDSEFMQAQQYIESLSNDYKGNIGFDLAAQYLDKCIEELFLFLKEKGVIDNTIFVVTADHGSSNFGGNVRYTATNNFYDEQYHIPVIATGFDSKEYDNKNYYSIKDIPFTILEDLGFDIPVSFSGKSLFSCGEKNTFVEYLGSGVPDLYRRPVQYLYRDDICAYLINAVLTKDYSEAKLLAYYDLKSDPYQFHNIVRSLNQDEVKKCLDTYRHRFLDLRNNYMEWLR